MKSGVGAAVGRLPSTNTRLVWGPLQANADVYYICKCNCMQRHHCYFPPQPTLITFNHQLRSQAPCKPLRDHFYLPSLYSSSLETASSKLKSSSAGSTPAAALGQRATGPALELALARGGLSRSISIAVSDLSMGRLHPRSAGGRAIVTAAVGGLKRQKGQSSVLSKQ